jgi:hypothetical protein
MMVGFDALIWLSASVPTLHQLRCYREARSFAASRTPQAEVSVD